MSERLKQILEEASNEVRQWPEWRKSKALKESEHALALNGNTSKQPSQEGQKANSAAAGK